MSLPALALCLAGVAMTAESPAESFLALGDSYTIGEGVDPEARWPVVLAERLAGAGHDLGTPEILARTGWSTDELLAAIDAADPRPGRRLVSLLAGVNDQYRGRGPEAYREPFETLLRRAIALADGDATRVLVLSIPDWGVTPFARQQGRDASRIAAEIDAFNAIAEELAKAHGAAYVGITDLTREAAGDPSLLTGDGLHPSARDYRRWVERALPVVLDRLRNGQ